MIAIKKPYYTEYVNHMLRFFVRNMERTEFKNDVDERNWLACYDVMASMPDDDYELVVAVFKDRYETMLDAVVGAANKFDIPVAKVWAVLNATSTKVARAAKLIA